MFFVYKTTNTINGKFYVGRHKTDNIDDGYIGSGTKLKHAISKYGRDNFVREVLEICETNDEVNARERYYISTLSPHYNIQEGGEGGFTSEQRNQYYRTDAGKQWREGHLVDHMRIWGSNTEISLKAAATYKERYKTGAYPKAKEHNLSVFNGKATCPHCNITTNKGNIKRWHLDRCKEVIHVTL